MATTFIFDTFDFDEKTSTLSLHYSFNNEHTFTETITFHNAMNQINTNELEPLFFYTHLACGISYYKAFLADNIKINSGKLTQKEADFFNTFYHKGLGEFAHENKVKLKNKIKFPFENTQSLKTNLNLKSGTIVCVGGGKDSITSIESLKPSTPNIKLLSVVSNPKNIPTPIKETIRIANLPSIIIQRTLSKKLIELNKMGTVYNGHVPISGILAFIIACGAKLYGYNDIVLSNERSANTGNTKWEGEIVNHQWSKSIEFENMFNELIHNRLNTSLHYFSYLRPLSEIQIVKAFAPLKKYHGIFTSCNRSFTIDEKKRLGSWCCACDKCRFVFLMLAPFLTQKEIIQIFGKNLLNDKTQLTGFKELVGLHNHKPFECVGEIDESALAILMLKNTEYETDAVVQAIRPVLEKKYKIEKLKEKYLSPSTEHNIPQKYEKAFHETF